MRRVLLLGLTLAASLAAAPAAQAARAHSSVVAGSAVTDISGAPYQVRVLVRSGSKTYQCGGSIHDATHIITAAHCVYINDRLAPPGNVTVGYGSVRTSMLQSAAVSSVTMPQLYTSDDSYDIAVLELSTPLAGYGSTVQPIPLAASADVAAGVSSEADTFATGWGATVEGGDTTSSLRGVMLPLRADSVCDAKYDTADSEYVESRTLCAGGKGTLAGSSNPDTCQGDSGGPLALDSGAGYALAGITSYGEGCGRPNVPGAYTEVSSPDILPFADGSAPDSAVIRATASGTTPTTPTTPTMPVTSAPAATTPVSQTLPAPTPASHDTTRPIASFTKFSCTKKHRCTVRVRSSDANGAVAKLTAVVSRTVTTCARRDGRRICRRNTRRKVLRVRRATGGFTATGTLTKATYTFTAVALDGAGNRSKRLTKRLRVR